MNKRRHIRKRSSADEDEEDEPIVLQPTEKRAKVSGISASALMKGDDSGIDSFLKSEPGPSKGFQANPAVERKADMLEKQMEEFIQRGLEKEFKADTADDEEGQELTKGPSLDEELNVIPEHMQGPATLDVVIPGFNTVITEYHLGADATLKSIEAAEAAKKALLHQSGASVPQEAPIKLSKNKQRPPPAVPRAAFPMAFGKQRQKQSGADDNQARRKR